MVKKSMVFVFLIVFMLTLVSAQSSKIEVSTKENYLSGENITLKVSLFDLENKPIKTNVELIFEDVEKREKIITSGETNKFIEIELGENPPSGFWTIKAIYEENEATTNFLIESEELAKFSLKGDTLTITNIGNTRYSKTIQIIIGDTAGIKKPDLEIGESISFRLVAPEGDYNIRVTDGVTSLIQGDVSLTGEVIGILDDRLNKRSPITGVGPENLETGGVFGIVKQSPFVYIFIIAVIGAMVLLSIERHYRKKAKNNF